MKKFLKDINVLKDIPENLIVLATKKAAEAGFDIGEAALHAGRHIPEYRKALDELQEIRKLYDAGKYGAKETKAAKEAAKKAVEEVQAALREGLKKGEVKLQHYDTVANRKKWMSATIGAMVGICALSGMSQAEAEEVTMAEVERMVEQESYYRQKNLIVRYGQAGYYVKDSNSKLARWIAFSVDFFNPVDDVITITDWMEDASKWAARKQIETLYLVGKTAGDTVEKDLLKYFDTRGAHPNSIWQLSKAAGIQTPGRWSARMTVARLLEVAGLDQ